MACTNLLNKLVVITGASSGLGKATAILFAQRGASVTLCGRDKDRLNAALEQCIEASGGHAGRFISVCGDVNDPEIRCDIVDKAVQNFGRLDILIPNAGVFLSNCDIFHCSEETFDTTFDTNVKSVFFLIQKALPHLERSGGNIVNISSITSTVVSGNRAIYPMSKAVVDHMTRCLALDLAPRGIRVNAVNPSYVPTRIRRYHGDDIDDLSMRAAELENPKHPLYGRCITPEDVANAIAFLASDAAKSITGQCSIVDGGRRFTGPIQ